MPGLTPQAWPARRRLSPRRIGNAASLALYEELALAPKPGLVSFEDSGSHADMDAGTFMASLFALRGYFSDMADLGTEVSPFRSLELRGQRAEAAMLAATGGANTHRGAVFMLGLLCAAAGAAQRFVMELTPAAVRSALQSFWGEDLAARARIPSRLPGGVAAARYGLRSASEEAALGYPVLFDSAMPSLYRSESDGLSGTTLRLQVFFEIMAVLDDANMARRGGLEGLALGRSAARAFLAQGGAAHPQAIESARGLHRRFVARRLSPGGCADTLSAALFLRKVCDASSSP